MIFCTDWRIYWNRETGSAVGSVGPVFVMVLYSFISLLNHWLIQQMKLKIYIHACYISIKRLILSLFIRLDKTDTHQLYCSWTSAHPETPSETESLLCHIPASHWDSTHSSERWKEKSRINGNSSKRRGWFCVWSVSRGCGMTTQL